MSLAQANKRTSQKRSSQLVSRNSQDSGGKSFSAALAKALKNKTSTFLYRKKLYTTSRFKKASNGTNKNKTQIKT